MSDCGAPKSRFRWSEQVDSEEESTSASDVGGTCASSGDDEKNRGLRNSTPSRQLSAQLPRPLAANKAKQPSHPNKPSRRGGGNLSARAYGSTNGSKGEHQGPCASENAQPQASPMAWVPACRFEATLCHGYVPPDAASCGAITAVPGAALPRPQIAPDVLRKAVDIAKKAAAHHQALYDMGQCQPIAQHQVRPGDGGVVIPACYAEQLMVPTWPGCATLVACAVSQPSPRAQAAAQLPQTSTSRCPSCGGKKHSETSNFCCFCGIRF